MADYQKAYKRTCKHEGGWANHPSDHGGQTWRGVARNFHPDWVGWKIIDKYLAIHKDTKSINALFADKELEQLVFSFYKEYFWDIHQLDKIDNQLLAENVFDCSVNCGVKIGARFLQQAINTVNPIYKLAIDGIIGPKTLAITNDAVRVFGESKVVDAYVDIRESYHKQIVARKPSQKVFLNNWLARCKAMRKVV